MAGVPGAGLLALLRKRSSTNEGDGASAVAGGGVLAGVAAPNKFEARSSAVHALEHAVASGTVGEAARPAAQGRRVPAGSSSYTYDVDVHAPHEAQPQLPVTPVTLINTDFALHHYRQIAVSRAYICYGLKQGHIRVLSRSSAVRALLKGHSKPLTDLQFAGGSGSAADEAGGGGLLASGGQDGQLYVWGLWLDEAAGTIQETQKLHAHFVSGGASAGDVFLSWHAPSRRVLAVGVGGKVLLVAVPAEGMEQLEFDLAEESTPDATVLSEWTGEPVSCLSFSPDGQLLAVGGSEGTVQVWELRSSAAGAGAGPALVAASSTAVPASTAGGVGAVRWLPAADGWVLLTGSRNCSVLQLWRAPGGASPGAAPQFSLLQTLRFEGKDGQQEFFIHVDVVPSQRLVVLADTARKAVYTLHYSGEDAALRFDYVSRFGVAVPILSFTALWSTTGGEQQDQPVVELNCVQTTAIQQYSLHPAMCHDGTADDDSDEAVPDDGIVRRSSLLERSGLDLGIKPQPSIAVPMPSAELASGTPTPRKAGASPAASPSKPSQLPSPPSPPKSSAADLPAAAAPPAVEAEGSGSGAPPAAEPSIDGVVSLAGIPPPPPPEDVAEPPEPKGASGEITPEECPSPPPTPTEQQRLQEEERQRAAAAAAAAAAAPPPRLLTPSDLMQSASASTTTTGRSSPASTMDSVTRQAASPATATRPQRVTAASLPPQPRTVVLPPPAAAAAGSPDGAPREQVATSSAAMMVGGEEDEEAVPPSPSTASAPAAAAPSASAAASGAAGLTPPQDAAVAAAVAEQMGSVHKKFVGHVSLMYRELLKALKTEMGAQAAAQQQAMAALLSAAVEGQRQQVEAERAAVLAEERANIERLLTAISATLNRDLPAKLQEAVRAELAGLGEAVGASVAAGLGPAVQQALGAALPKELAGAVKAGLDKQLAPAVSAGLGKPLQDAFRTAFTKQVVPAFEAATQTMFQQVNTALAAGLEEHLQATRAALSEPSQLASQLTSSLSSAQQLAASLAQGQQQLIRAQSLSGAHSPAAPADVRSELGSLLRSGQYEQAFSKALSLQDVATVGWLACQADAATVLSKEPCPLSQMVLLSLVQQLSADLTTDLGAKLAWIREAAMQINPQDPVLSRHVRPVLDSVRSALQAAAGRLSGAEASNCRLAMHVLHSLVAS